MKIHITLELEDEEMREILRRSIGEIDFMLNKVSKK